MKYQDHVFLGYTFDCVYPPIPTRTFDWCAYDDGRIDCDFPVSYHGITPQDLMEQILEDFWGHFLGIDWRFYR
jgi:hypothetical protein